VARHGPTLTGWLYASSMTGQRCLRVGRGHTPSPAWRLWAPASDSFPPAPKFARGIAVPAARWQPTLREAAAELRYTYA